MTFHDRRILGERINGQRIDGLPEFDLLSQDRLYRHGALPCQTVRIEKSFSQFSRIFLPDELVAAVPMRACWKLGGLLKFGNLSFKALDLGLQTPDVRPEGISAIEACFRLGRKP
jgi:hypothetical protein